jgi:hypothetical protein
MVNMAISCAKSHGINVHRGVVNMGNGNCAFETMIDSINTRTCFEETFDGSPGYWRKVWMTEVEKIAFDSFNGGLSRAEWKEGWEKLKQSGTYEYELGDLVLPGIAHCTRKDVLIFNTSPQAHSPVYVIQASTFGGSSNTDIPVCLAYDQNHYESLVPDSPEDIQKTIDVKKSYLQGTYNKTIQDIPALKAQCKASEEQSDSSSSSKRRKSLSLQKSKSAPFMMPSTTPCSVSLNRLSACVGDWTNQSIETQPSFPVSSRLSRPKKK